MEVLKVPLHFDVSFQGDGGFQSQITVVVPTTLLVAQLVP